MAAGDVSNQNQTGGAFVEQANGFQALMVAIGNTPPGTGTGVIQVAGQHGGAVDSFTRPSDTNAYAIGDAITNATSSATPLHFASVMRVNGGSGYVVKAILMCDNVANIAQVRLHLYSASPTTPNDNAAWSPLYADLLAGNPIYKGYIDFPALYSPAASGGAAVAVSTTVLSLAAAAGAEDFYGILQTMTAFSPVSGSKFAVRLSVDQN